MNTFRLLTLGFCFCISTSLFSQPENAIQALNFKLQLLSDNETWAVFVVPGEAINPSTKTSTGSGQVTIVAPAGFAYENFRNHGGTWVENARVESPMEAPDKSYVSFGFVIDEPKIMLIPNEETLLFTFTSSNLNDEIALIDNINDPFATPNSYGSNPGNDLGMLDFGTPAGMQVYAYGSNLDHEMHGRPSATHAKNLNARKGSKAVLTSDSEGGMIVRKNSDYPNE